MWPDSDRKILFVKLNKYDLIDTIPMLCDIYSTDRKGVKSDGMRNEGLWCREESNEETSGKKGER